MKSNPRPRKYASDAERQAAFRARNVLVEFRAEPKTADKLTEIAAAIDVSRSDLLLSMVKFALTNHDWARFGLTHKTIPLYQGNPIMATKLTAKDRLDIFNQWFNTSGHWIYPNKEKAYQTWTTKGIDGIPDYLPNNVKTNPVGSKKASPAQIAARKRFAEMARSGELAKTRKKAVKKNPVALSEKRAGKVKRNPAKKLYTVCRADAKGNPVYHIAHFNKQADAKQYAQAYADLHKTPVAITSKAM